MAASVTVVRRDSLGTSYVVYADVTGDTSYPTGGYALTKGQVGLTNITGAHKIGGNPASALVLPHWDTTNKKLMFVLPTGGGAAPATLTAPVAGAAGLGTLAVAAPALGTLAATATPASGATAVQSTSAQPAIPVTFTGALAAPAVSGALAAAALTAGEGLEVGSTTDVSSLTFRMMFIGT